MIDPKTGEYRRFNEPSIAYEIDSCRLLELSPNIPRHSQYNAPRERLLYINHRGYVVAQGILFDGVMQEQYLILTRKNGGKRWIWTDRLPDYKQRKSIWKIDH